MKNRSIEIGNCTDVGMVRSQNQDYYGAYEGKYGSLIIVADGMGGHEGGEAASRLTVEGVRDHFAGLPAEFTPRVELAQSLHEANRRITAMAAETSELLDMGSTAVVLLLRDEQAYAAHIGDSRIYLVRKQQIYQLTKDHSLVQQMIDANMISAADARSHPQKNIITRALGANKKGEPEVSQAISIFQGDTFLLCTDGLLDYVIEAEMIRITSEHPPQKAAELLVEMAKQRGGADNITVQVVRVVKGKHPPMSQSTRKALARLALAAALIASGVGLSYLFTGTYSSEKRVSDGETASDSTSGIEKQETLPGGKRAIGRPVLSKAGTPIIAIDIGHAESGSDEKSYSGQSEAYYSKEVARTLVNQLKEAGFDSSFIIPTEAGNPSVRSRLAAARARNAYLMLSLRTGTIQPSGWARKTSDEKKRILEECSGYAIVISDKDSLLAAQNSKLGQLIGRHLREAHLAPFLESAKMNSTNRRMLNNDGVYRHNELEILKQASVPVVRIEYGILMNSRDEKQLRKAEYREKMAKAIVEALQEYSTSSMATRGEDHD